MWKKIKQAKDYIVHIEPCSNCGKNLFLRTSWMISVILCKKCYHELKKEQVKRNYALEQKTRCLTTCLSESMALSKEQAEKIIEINGGVPKNCGKCQMLSAIQKYFKTQSNNSDEITDFK